jgi:hypothetical protein
MTAKHYGIASGEPLLVMTVLLFRRMLGYSFDSGVSRQWCRRNSVPVRKQPA